MTSLERTIDIAAPSGVIWAIVSDLPDYEKWNPFIVKAAGSLAAGEPLELIFRVGPRTFAARPKVQVMEPGHRLAWLGRVALPGLFDAAHELIVEPLAGDRSRLVQRERFRGLLVPFFGRLLKDTALGFEAMNLAVKTRAEALQRPAASPDPISMPRAA